MLTFVGNARVLGVSELTEGTHEFAGVIQMILADAHDQGSAASRYKRRCRRAMEIDRYVRTGIGNPRQWLRALGSHWNTQEVLSPRRVDT